ncbi:hypothetical protein GYMLUDRAFT_954339 [Collybiopsis luxurians FD-317 M1]|nr:hypothetical protein GYMLUDRAFT_954339 [Collybiopsis luxurians FD-317 M1]
MAMYPEYQSFQVYDEDGDYVFKNIADGDDGSEFLYVVSIYRGVPVGQTVDNALDDGNRYLYLGKSYGNCFMRLQDFGDRFAWKTLEADFEKLEAGRDDLFPVWSLRGKTVPLPRNFVATYVPGVSLEEWSDAQRKQWSKVIQSTGEATPTVPYNVFARFIQPATFNGFELVFSSTESESHVSKAELETYVKQAMNASDAPDYPYRVVSWQQASNDASLILLSSSFYPFYHTWITSANYERVYNTNPLVRPWPKDATAATAVDILLGKVALPEDGLGTETLVSAQKIKAAHGMRVTVPSQKAVMGASATEVAKLLWPTNTLDPNRRPADAEWLHRSAFHFAGLGNNVDLSSSQSRLNLVFGTGECNTDMIRGENAVSDLANLLRDSKGGTLTTENIVKGNMDRRRPNGLYDTQAIPVWVETERNKGQGELIWLSMKLAYRFTMSDQDLNLDFNSVATYDPFSRYAPFRIEARLDQIILREVVQKHSTITGQPQKKKPKIDKGSSQLLISTLDISQPLTRSATFPGFVSATMDTDVPRPVRIISSNPSLFPVPTLLTATPRSALHFNPSTALDTPPLPPPTVQEWSRVVTGADAIEVNGAVVRSPNVLPHEGKEPTRALKASRRRMSFKSFTGDMARGSLSPLPGLEASPPPEGFTIEGEIDLFGISDVKARFYSWNGPVPPEVLVRVNKPIYDKAIISGDFKLSSILPVLESTPFNNLTFRDVTFTYQNCVFDVTKAIGWHVDADFVIDASYGSLYDLLRMVLNVQEPIIHLHAGLGLNQGWGRRLALSSFTLDGTFPGIHTKISDGLTLTSIGVELLGIQRMEIVPRPRSVMDFGFGVFGTLNIDLPGLTIPLELSYRIVEIGGLLQLTADLDGEIWKDPFGIKGLWLSNVFFTGDIQLGSPMRSFDFEVTATFQYKSTAAIFNGSYAAGGAFSLTAAITNFNLMNINDIFESITNGSLNFPDLDVRIGSASITVASGSGLTIALQNVRVGDHVAANALLNISPSGVVIRGDVTSNNPIVFGDVELRKAYLEITLPNKLKGSGVLLGGEIAFESFTLDALVHLYEGRDGSGFQWTVIASLSAAGNTLALSRLTPELKGTFLDLALSNAVFVAASQEDPLVFSYLATPYSIHQGVQICATLSPIEALDSLMRSPTPTSGLILSAGWSKTTGFALDVIMPSESVIHLGNGIVTDPFTLRIQGGISPMLLVIAGVQIPVEPKGNKLDFRLSLGINVLGASASAQVHGWWVNPLGLGEEVKIGPDVALAIEIFFAQFLATGTPSGFGIVGGLAIGKTSASVAMQISENPMNEVLSGEVQALNINDIVSLANVITRLDIPQPPKFLDFEDVKLYICPNGITIGTIIYPQGFSFQAAMVLFGKRAEIACAVGSSSVTIKGGVDNFTLGPLVVRGVNQPRATVDIALERARQHILIDGMVTFFEESCAVSIQVDVLPNPQFSFYTALKFTDLLVFTLEARLVGALTFGEIDQADFEFYASLEQLILEYVRQQIEIQFDAARTAADAGFKAAERDLKEAEDTVNKGIDDAQSDLDTASKVWDTKRKEVTDNANRIINEYLGQIDVLQGNIDQAQHDYDKALSDAEAALQTANNDRASALQSAQADLEKAKHDAQASIDSAMRDVETAEDKMNRDFGNAERDIQSAQDKVNDLQRQIDNMQRDIDHYNSLPWYDPRRAAVVGLGVSIAALWSAKNIAVGVLEAAKAVVQGTGYLADKAAIGAAEGVLQAARNAAPGLISVAQTVLDGVDKSTEAAVDAAQGVVDATRIGVEYGALEGAKATLELYKSANKAVFDEAQHALDTLLSTLEYIAYQSATAAFAVAKAATSSLDGLKEALVIAQRAEDVVLKIAQWVAQQVTGIVDIRKIELSGSLRGLVTPGGAVGKPLKAHVEYMLAGRSGTMDGELDLRQTSAFITAIFKHLWEEVKDIV